MLASASLRRRASGICEASARTAMRQSDARGTIVRRNRAVRRQPRGPSFARRSSRDGREKIVATVTGTSGHSAAAPSLALDAANEPARREDAIWIEARFERAHHGDCRRFAAPCIELVVRRVRRVQKTYAVLRIVERIVERDDALRKELRVAGAKAYGDVSAEGVGDRLDRKAMRTCNRIEQVEPFTQRLGRSEAAIGNGSAFEAAGARIDGALVNPKRAFVNNPRFGNAGGSE